IVDELDRCRPLHAIQFLERIKHFFAVPNVAFVFGRRFSQPQKIYRRRIWRNRRRRVFAPLLRL
ncbi:MAG: hypothetical protein IJE77_06490, partial [Thermoguttaceae bacterium]|nr:hypothetical protein [Thermoguttaceae bacterium]